MSDLYRKLPKVIEARQFTGDHENAVAVVQWICDNTKGFDPKNDHTWPASSYYGELKIRTLEGEMTAQSGDWIIRGIEGEFYPCKPDIFAATYEPAEAPSQPPERAVDWRPLVVVATEICAVTRPFLTQCDEAYAAAETCEHKLAVLANYGDLALSRLRAASVHLTRALALPAPSTEGE